MDYKKVIVCDLDGTLAVSKSALSRDMAVVLAHVLKKYKVAVVSGGSYKQFEKQFLSGLSAEPEVLSNLHLFPTMGTTCYVFDLKKGVWVQQYDEPLDAKSKKSIIKALQEVISESGIEKSEYGELVEDRGSQITFSALGQEAPIHLKQSWDPAQSKRKAMVEKLKKMIPNFAITIGGTTSIDITKKGLDKAYAIGKIEKLLNVSDEDIIFIGDALYKGGNDEAVKSTGVDFIQPDGPDSTLEILSRYM